MDPRNRRIPLPGFHADASLKIQSANYDGMKSFEPIRLIVPAAPTASQCRNYVCPACRNRGQACGLAQWCEDRGYCWL